MSDERLTDDLADFCAACYGAPKVRVIRRAVRCFIDAELAEKPELRRRFNEARDKRLATQGGNIVQLRRTPERP